MATKYSDIVTLRESKPAYNIQNEQSGEWNVFIANDQFNEILKRVIRSVFNNDADQHKSFWISGTYGTGKSHAGAVIKHLLCDPLEDIREYVNEEYASEKYEILRNDLFNLRGQKRLLPVMLYGQQSITHKEDLSLQLQRSITSALQNADIDIVVKTDFDKLIDHIQEQPKFWDMLIEENALLASTAPTHKKLIQYLEGGDTATFGMVMNALRDRKYDIRLDNENISQWIFEVQDKLVKGGVYDGLFIIWDEFTDVMTSPIGLSLLVALQEITERAMNSENNSYFMFISHPSALNLLKEEEREKTKGRYHYMSYNMEPVSAFKIMSRKFKTVNSEIEYLNLSEQFYDEHSELLSIFSKTSTNPEETQSDLRHLYPLHPSTANLATYYAREAGSSSRSVFEFLGANPAIKEFLDNEEHFSSKDTITADYLWDYVQEVFNANISRFGAVTERFNSYKLQVENEGSQYFAVFKSILLLNALNNIANNETVTPSEENIKNLFVGTSIDKNIDNILDFLNDRSIIQRAPGGMFSILFSALPPKEIEDIKQRLATTQFKYTSQIVNFGDTARLEVEKFLANVARANQFIFYSEDVNEYTLLNKIENGYKQAKSYEVFMALLFARNMSELQTLKEFAIKASSEERFQNVMFVVFESIFTENNYARFIEYQANASCAQSHGFADQQKMNTKLASEMIKEWMNDIRRSNFTYYVRGEQDINSTTKIASTINGVVSPIIFSKGPESLEIIRIKFSKTFWKKASVKGTVDSIISFNSKDEIIQRCGGPAQHVTLLLQDSVNDNLDWKPDIDKSHTLYQVCELVDKKFRYTDKSTSFNLAEKLQDLSRPPFGLYQSYAGMGMLAFAMKKYVKQIFDLNGKPRESQHVVEDVVETFKAWEEGKLSNKLTFMFETKEARDLCENLIQKLQLNKLKGYNDISSLTDARWAITREYSKEKGYPLWSLKYIIDAEHDNLTETQVEGLKKLLDNILKVCEDSATRNPHLMSETLDGLETFDFEFVNLLNKQNAFEKGFINYLKSIYIVNLHDSEVSDALKYISKNLQGEIGLWSESEVEGALKNWKIETTQQVQEPSIQPLNPPDNISPSTLEPVEYQKKQESAKERVNQIQDIDDAKGLLVKICNCGYESILDIINGYV